MEELIAWIIETPLGNVSFIIGLWLLLIVPLMIRVDVGLAIQQLREFVREMKSAKSCR